MNCSLLLSPSQAIINAQKAAQCVGISNPEKCQSRGGGRLGEIGGIQSKDALEFGSRDMHNYYRQIN